MSLLRQWINKDFKLIKQTCRIAVTWHYLRKYHIWINLANIFMLIKDIISPRWTCWLNRNFFLIHQTCRIAVACHHLGWYWILVILAKIFSCDQAAIWLVQVRLSVCLSVRPFSPCSHHHIIMKFSGVITMVRSDVHAKGQGQRSKVKVTEVNTQLSRFRTLTPVWIHIWQWNHAHSRKQHRRGALLFFKVIRKISRSHGSKNRRIWPRLGVSGL